MEPEERGVTEAAGGVVWRRTDSGLEFLVVFRGRLDGWSLPKGSVEPGESTCAAAIREVAEETGFQCELGEPLAMTEWIRDDGSLRRCHWWLMRPQRSGEPRAGDSVTRSEWMSLGEAVEILSQDRDRGVLKAAFGSIPNADESIRAGRMQRTGRACAAVLRRSDFGTEILMVRHRDYWTLPGGGVNGGESSAEAAVRELREETGLHGAAVRELFGGCWEVRVDPSARVSLGHDPELSREEQPLRGVAWFTLEEKHDDRQVSLVIAALGDELNLTEK